MSKRIVIIGGGTAGASAAFAARKTDRQAEITVIARESYPTYSRCGLPFAVSGIIPKLENLVVFPASIFAAQKITLKLNSEATRIDTKAKEIIYNDADSKETGITYDSLVIASGSVPSVPGPLAKTLSGRKYFTLRTIDDARQIMQEVGKVATSPANRVKAKSALVIGASFIGLELAEALKEKYQMDVTLIEQFRLLWRMLDADTGKLVRDHLSAHGIKVKEGETLPPCGGAHLSATPTEDLVIISAGIRPEVKIFQDAGITIGPSGGFKTDERLQTNIPGIYAAGDCAEVISGITGEPFLIGLGTIAARQGVVAGTNAALLPGGEAHLAKDAPIVLNASVLKLFGWEIGAVGFTEEYYKKSGKLNPVATLIKFPSLPHYYPGGTDVYIKLIANCDTGAVIGGQVIGTTSVAQRVDMLSLMIERRMTVVDIIRSDFCYSPPVADIWEPIAIAAQALERLMRARK